MKRKHVILGVIGLSVLAIGGVLANSFVKANNRISEVKADEISKTYYEKDFTGLTTGDYADDSALIQTELGFYAGHYLRTNGSLFNISGKSSNGPYFIVEINANEGDYLTSLKWEATGRFYYSSGANDPRATLYVSTDPTTFADPVKSVRGEYGAYQTRTAFNADLTPYLPSNCSKIYIKYIIEVHKNSNGFSNDWFKIDKLKIAGTEIAEDSYVEPAKSRTINIEDNFVTTGLNVSNVFHFQNLEGRASSHGVVPGLWGDPVNIANELESFVEYMIPATSTGLLGETKVNLNAKIWNQNNETCHNENSISVYAGTSEDSLTLVREFHCTDTSASSNFVDLSEVDVTNYVAGSKVGYVKIALFQSKAASVTAATAAINGVTYESSKINLSNVGVKLGAVEISATSVYQCPAENVTFLSKDFSTETDFGAESVSGFEIGNPEGSYYGFYNTNPANMASLVYKFTTDAADKLISSMSFAFSESRYAYYSGSNNTLFKLSVSKDGTNYTNVVTDTLPTSALSAKTFDLSTAVNALHSSVVYLKIEEGSKNPGMGSTKGWFCLKKVTVSGAITEHDLAIQEGVVICNECGSVIYDQDVEVLTFYCNQYLKMGVNTENQCLTLFAEAKAQLANLSAAQKSLLASGSDYADALARLNAWAVANGDTIEFGLSASKSTNLFMNNKNNALVMVVIASTLSIFAIGFVVLRKKFKQN